MHVYHEIGIFQERGIQGFQDFIPDGVNAAQIRCAVTAVLKKCEEGGLFDDDGWLVPGVYGCQPDLAEAYINTGSLYLCCAVFLALGVSPDHPFWTDADEWWTQKKLWSGENLPGDHYDK